MISEVKYYCKDRYLPNIPNQFFLAHLNKLRSGKKECASYLEEREFVHLSTEEPCIISPLVDITQSPMGYGKDAVPKLLADILSGDKMKAYQSLNTLLYLLYKPEKVAETVRHNVVGRLLQLMSGKEDFICISALCCMRVLCMQPVGKLAILKNPCSLMVLKRLLKDCMPDVRNHAVLTASVLATNYTAVHLMVENGFIQVVMDLINNVDNSTLVLKELLLLLELLLDDGDSSRLLAITCDALEIVGLFHHTNSDIRKLSAAIIAQLFHSNIGKLAATRKDIISKIKDQLNDPNASFKAKLVSALMFATVDIEARKMASDLSIVNEMLEIISTYDIPRELEISAVKVLTNLAELPHIRKKLRLFLGNVLSLPTFERENIQRHIDTLIQTILWEP